MCIRDRYLDILSLGDIASGIAADIDHIGLAEPSPGDHCTGRYCKAISVCPATTQAMTQLMPDTALIRKEWRYGPVIESPDHLAHMLMIRPLIRKACAQVDAAIEAYVSNGPVTTSDGRTIRQSFRDMPRENAGLLRSLAKELGATDEQIAMCTRINHEGNGVRVYSGRKKGE